MLTNPSVSLIYLYLLIVVKLRETMQFLVNDFPSHYKDNTDFLTVKWSALN